MLPMLDDDGNVLAAKLIVYAGEPEEYYCFITPTAYRLLKEWVEFRRSYGEQISDDSWLMRDLWQTTNMDYRSKSGLATILRSLRVAELRDY
jgi:hypothetical protein